MNRGSIFVLGIIVGGVAMAFSVQFTLNKQPRDFPEPDVQVTIDNEDWHGYDVTTTQPSAKCWVNRHGVIYEPSGVKFPAWDEALEREDDTRGRSGATETALRRGAVHDVRRKACRCPSPNRL